MERRVSRRIPARVNVRFCCYKKEYSGTVSNISENGMFINTDKIIFPFDLRFEILVPFGGKTIKIHAEVRRITKSYDGSDGLAVKILNPHQTFFKFIDGFRVFSTRELGKFNNTNRTADISV